VSQDATAALSREIGDAGRSLVRLLRYDPAWPDGFDFSFTGFVRSFFGPLLALPFFLVFAALVSTRGGVEPLPPQTAWAAGLGHLIYLVAFPVIVALLAKPLGFASGYAAFIVVVNWANLFLNMVLAAISPLALLGQGGFGLLSFLWLALFGLSVFVTWRAARETLSAEMTPALLMVVLAIGVGVGSDQVSTLLVRAIG